METMFTSEEMPSLPKDWEWIRIEKAISKPSLTNKKINQRNYLVSGKVPIIDQGASLIGGYTDDKSKVVNVDLPAIIFGDHTKIIKFINFSFAPGADGIKVLKPNYSFNPKLFYYFLNAIELPEKGYARHFQYLEKSYVSRPPLPEQELIVSKIEELFTQLDAAEAALKRAKNNLKRYKQSLLQAAVTGELTREWREEHKDELEPANKLLERIKAERRSKWEAEMKAKGKNPTKEKYKEPSPPDTSNLPELPDGWCWVRISLIADHRLGKMLDKDKNLGQLLPYLRNANVQWFDFDLSDLKSIKIKKEELENVSIEKGDLIICEGGEPGRSAVWYHDYPIVIQKALHRVRFPERILPEYVNYHLANDAKTGLLERHFTGSTIKHFTGESLSKYILALPPFDEQLKILELVENNYSKVQQLIQLCNNTLIKIQNTRKSILKKAFLGFL